MEWTYLSDLALQLKRQLLRLGQQLRHARHLSYSTPLCLVPGQLLLLLLVVVSVWMGGVMNARQNCAPAAYFMYVCVEWWRCC